MKIGVIPEDFMERAALAAGVVARPQPDTHVAIMPGSDEKFIDMVAGRVLKFF